MADVRLNQVPLRTGPILPAEFMVVMTENTVERASAQNFADSFNIVGLDNVGATDNLDGTFDLEFNLTNGVTDVVTLGFPSPTNYSTERGNDPNNLDIATSTATAPTTYLSLSENFIPGDYEITVHYMWNLDATGSDFVSNVLLDGNPLGVNHEQEPQDSAGSFGTTGTNQKFPATRVFKQSLSGSQTIDLIFNTSVVGTEASMISAIITAKKVS